MCVGSVFSVKVFGIFRQWVVCLFEVVLFSHMLLGLHNAGICGDWRNIAAYEVVLNDETRRRSEGEKGRRGEGNYQGRDEKLCSGICHFAERFQLLNSIGLFINRS